MYGAIPSPVSAYIPLIQIIRRREVYMLDFHPDSVHYLCVDIT